MFILAHKQHCYCNSDPAQCYVHNCANYFPVLDSQTDIKYIAVGHKIGIVCIHCKGSIFIYYFCHIYDNSFTVQILWVFIIIMILNGVKVISLIVRFVSLGYFKNA
jgi:hypothetical protein